MPCIIPARGGSKGLPRKNIIPLNGQPLISWTIEAAHASASIDQVFVSTEDEEIATVAADYGAEVLTRPVELAQDETSSEAVLLDTLQQWEALYGNCPNYFVFIQCTSPMLAAEDIDGAVALFEQEKADSLVSVTPGYYNLWQRKEDRSATPANHDISYRLRRQERGPDLRENGCIYVVRSEVFREVGMRYCGKVVLYEMPMIRSFEIDDLEDLHFLEILMQAT